MTSSKRPSQAAKTPATKKPATEKKTPVKKAAAPRKPAAAPAPKAAPKKTTRQMIDEAVASFEPAPAAVEDSPAFEYSASGVPIPRTKRIAVKVPLDVTEIISQGQLEAAMHHDRLTQADIITQAVRMWGKRHLGK